MKVSAAVVGDFFYKNARDLRDSFENVKNMPQIK